MTVTITLSTRDSDHNMAVALLRRLLARRCFRDVVITSEAP